MADKTHPTATLTSIKFAVPIVLDMEKGQYSHCVKLFKIHCRVHKVLDHIIPPPPPKEGTPATEMPADELEEWRRLDALVLQWIYGTISGDLLSTIIVPDTTAQKAWNNFGDIFQDNENSCAVYLEQQFNAVHIDNFSCADAYCRELKTLADQLANVGAPVSNNRLVLRLITGLNSNYDGVAVYLQQQKPLPSFHEARSRLILEETRKQKQTEAAASQAATVLVTTMSDDGTGNSSSGHNNNKIYNHTKHNNHKGGKGGGRGKS